ncbi:MULTISPECIES: cation transporter [unclassified Paenibacillus]|uniref:cation transporter n=1 Tax=unclassified Paenibacillus TaxID=185978 RepID=UPI0009AD710F|nr:MULTISPECIES: cation transporter [unclassified Paenibacillus]MBE1441689.1 copper chaperone [Paenibacillus sp. OAS669]
MKQTILQVEGMSCGHCVGSIEGALKEIGVQGKVDLASKSVSIQYEETNVTLASIKDAIEAQGYDVK